MKNILKINQKVNKKSMLIIGVLFFANLMLVSAGNIDIEIDGERSKTLEVKEVELELENWMLNTDLFQKMLNKGEIFFIEEGEMNLEPWMLEPELFGEKLQENNYQVNLQERETENEIELEPWMLNIDKF